MDFHWPLFSVLICWNIVVVDPVRTVRIAIRPNVELHLPEAWPLVYTHLSATPRQLVTRLESGEDIVPVVNETELLRL